jgi:hypothetical protein
MALYMSNNSRNTGQWQYKPQQDSSLKTDWIYESMLAQYYIWLKGKYSYPAEKETSLCEILLSPCLLPTTHVLASSFTKI